MWKQKLGKINVWNIWTLIFTIFHTIYLPGLVGLVTTLIWRHDTQHNDTQNNNKKRHIQYNGSRYWNAMCVYAECHK